MNLLTISLILLLVVLIIFVVFCFNRDYFTYDENKEVYRLGDILTNQAICTKDKCEPASLSLKKIIKD